MKNHNAFYKIFIVLTSLFFLFFPASAEDNMEHYERVFARANEFYSAGKFDSALVLYQSIVDAEYESEVLYYNLGNSCYKMKNIPAAILYYEKAKKLKPDDADVFFNLQLANQQITDKIEPLPELFVTRWWKGMISSMSVDGWGKWTLVFFFYSVIMLTLFILSASAGFRKTSFWSGLAGVILSAFSFSIALKQEKLLTKNNEAIVFAPSTTSKSSPDENSTNLFVIHEGTKVKILEKLNEWIKISIADGNIGWIDAGDVREI